MSFSTTQTQNDAMLLARQWLGTPFRHQGRILGKGVDCAGVVIEVARVLGVIDGDYDEKNYPRRSPHSGAFMQYFAAHLEKIPNNQARPGDVGVFKEPVFPCHCGIFGWRDNTLTLIHSHAPRKKVVEEFFVQSGWDKKLVAVFRFPEVNNG